MVFRNIKIQFIQITASVNRIQNQLEIRIFIFSRNLVVQAVCIEREFSVIIHNGFKFVVIFQAIRFAVQRFRRHSSVVFRIKIYHPRNFLGMLFSKLFRSPIFRVFQEIIGIELFRIPSHFHKETDRKFHWFQIANIYNPNLVNAVFISQIHLFPNSLDWTDVDPFRISWSTNIIKVIIHSVTAFVQRFVQIRKLADVAPIVITKQQNHVVRNFHSFIIIILNFLVQSPNLRHFVRIFPSHILDNFTLVFNDIFQQRNVGVFAHRFVAVATHSDGYELFPVFAPFNSRFPELLQNFCVFGIIPNIRQIIFFDISMPIGLRQSHRFVVRSSHHNSHFVG